MVGILADAGAISLQALALGLGSVALVQTLLVAGLPLAAVLLALLAHRRLRRHEVVGLVLCSAGLAGAAAGAVIGAGSVLLAVAAGRFGDWSALFGSWALRRCRGRSSSPSSRWGSLSPC